MVLLKNHKTLFFGIICVGCVIVSHLLLCSIRKPDWAFKETEMDWAVGVPVMESDLTWRLGEKYLVRGNQEINGSGDNRKNKRFSNSRWCGTVSNENGSNLTINCTLDFDNPKGVPVLNMNMAAKISSNSQIECVESCNAGLLLDMLFILSSPLCKKDYREPCFADISKYLGESSRGTLIYFPMGIQTNHGETYQLVKVFLSAALNQTIYHADGIVKCDMKTRILHSAEMNTYSVSGGKMSFTSSGEPVQDQLHYTIWRRKFWVVLQNPASGGVSPSQ